MEYESIELKDQTPCSHMRADLKNCLLDSDCCQIRKKTPRQCLQTGDIEDKCISLRNAFFECKRSLIDMRARFRGRKDY